ncbi:aldo/keto reductase [Spongisporangium articulatum]|uniref:Aldo/keto reductase n=1 Tax=Spongisporangium articulatum TaxID=3362603 RepID=A0ABW8ARZ5_9ACTN
MEQRYVGRTGLRVSRLGLGTLTWGRDTREEEAGEQLRELLEAGGDLVDVGTGYGDGAAEEVLGKLIGPLAHRDELVISAKAVVPSYATGPDLSRRSVIAALDATLTRLGVDHVDLWTAPGWSSHVPLAETLSALETAVRSGRARYAGLANVDGWQATLATATASGGAVPTGGAAPGVPVAVQTEYSLLCRGPERELLPAARHLGLGVIGWSPLGRGVLTGKYRAGTPADSRAASPHLARFVQPYLERGPRRVVDALVTAADGLGCDPLDVALGWVLNRPGVSAVLVGARTAAQFRASLAAEETELPAEIVNALNEISAPPS